ncbi:hypothetical protein [Companilactobacillus zhongbaensis]|uniref:hypothetical protein n=1 Tax=Companilactobacillus zhongbaensis TaxID=2486009 RepID=UPI000F7888D5|nr:hypothetical protein [Companilactobacillus zhongbaensis]
MATSKYFNAVRGIPDDASFLSPYLGLKLGLSDLVFMPEDIFNEESALLNKMQNPLYNHVVENQYNRKLSSVINNLPVNMQDFIVSVRSESEYEAFLLNLSNNLKNSPLHGMNKILASIDVLKNPSDFETLEFYYYLENSEDDVVEFFKYEAIGATQSYATTLEKAVGALDNIYEKQCHEFKRSGAAYGVDPRQITNFNAIIERVVANQKTGERTVDKENTFTLKPNQFIDDEL